MRVWSARWYVVEKRNLMENDGFCEIGVISDTLDFCHKLIC